MKIQVNRLVMVLLLLINSVAVIGQVAKTHVIHFETSSFTPSSIEDDKLVLFLRNIEHDGNITEVKITGYCDDRGSSNSNDVLSMNRAKAVQRLIERSGVEKQAFKEVKGGGELKLTKKNRTLQRQEREQNRRVEIWVKYYERKPIHIVKPEVVEEVKVIEEEVLSETKAQQLFTTETKVGDRIVLDNILFEGGRHYILPESAPSLKNLLKTLKQETKYHVIILGHICCHKAGSDGLDKDTGRYDLSEARAEVIYKYLVANGVDKNRLDHKGMKADYKLGGADKYDRRVEIEITKIVEE